MIQRLPEDAQTLHSEMLALLLAREGERNWSHLSGTFASKQIKGAEYVYFQYSDPGGARRQFSVGRRSEAIAAIIAGYARGRAEQGADLEQISRLAGLLRAAGVAMVPHAPARVIRGLTDAGLFSVGGVLVGSYAFQVLGDALGVEWPGAAWRTQDIDIATQLLVAVPAVEADVPKALESLQMGFVPVPQLDAKQPSTSFRVRGKPLRVDLITPGGERDLEPVFIPRFRAAAAPIKFLSLVMRESQPAAVVDGTTASLVVVPAPARFALHKLLVSQTRSVIQQTKGGKDLHQAALLLEVLAEDRPDDLSTAAGSFAESGPTVTRKVLRGLEAAARRWPDAGPGADIVRSVLSQ
ncbi:MAG: nucleotidyltransferase domain-containing protein [Planctomycetes bacterium]|nr:nucleotidyltransferase domain-containing protein [Planctomycetota bacterium]